MIGPLLGLVASLGLLLVIEAFAAPRSPGVRGRLEDRLAELLAQAGIEGVTPARLVMSSVGLGAIAGLLILLVSGTLSIAVAFSAMAVAVPTILIRRRRAQRRQELRALWPDVIDNVTSSVRAGLSLPEALAQVGERGPDALRGPFASFAIDYRATGRFDESLDLLKGRLADPVGDRLVEAVRVARQVGGHDLGRLLRTFSALLRDDLRTRGELESRQSWTVNGARLAVAAPWLLLILLSVRSQAVAAYDTTAGVVVLAVGAAVCVVAYRLMVRIGRLPEDDRVLR